MSVKEKHEPIDFIGPYKKILAFLVMVPISVILFISVSSIWSLTSENASRIHRGMSKSDVREILGKPRHVYDNGSWSYLIDDRSDMLHVMFHPNGIVKNVSY